MLHAVVSLDGASKKPIVEKTIKVGDNFDVVVMFYDDGKGETPKFDTFISEVLYNDSGPVVQMDLDKLPSAGVLGDHSTTTVDAFSLRRVEARGEGTLLTRPDPTPEPAGARTRAADMWRVGRLVPGYSMGTGRAGLSDFGKPFHIGTEAVSAVKGRASVRKDARALQEGVTRLTPIVTAFLGSHPVPVVSDVSTIKVVE